MALPALKQSVKTTLKNSLKVILVSAAGAGLFVYVSGVDARLSAVEQRPEIVVVQPTVEPTASPSATVTPTKPVLKRVVTVAPTKAN